MSLVYNKEDDDEDDYDDGRPNDSSLFLLFQGMRIHRRHIGNFVVKVKRI